jgi:hypothetical protein
MEQNMKENLVVNTRRLLFSFIMIDKFKTFPGRGCIVVGAAATSVWVGSDD